MIYEILSQNPNDERVFELKDELGRRFNVDIYTDGKLNYPEGADATPEEWRKWLSTFVGKKIFIERIQPCSYFSGGETYLI